MRTGNDLRWIGIALIMVIAVLVVAPPAQAATVGGTVDTVDLGAKKMTIKETSGTKLTLA